MSLFIKNIFLVQLCLILAILYPTSLANLVVEVGTRHSHQTLLTAHYGDVIMSTIASQITSLTIVYSTVYYAQIKENIKAPRHWPLSEEFTGEFPAQMASNAEDVSIWWRHHQQPGTPARPPQVTSHRGEVLVPIIGTLVQQPSTTQGVQAELARWRSQSAHPAKNTSTQLLWPGEVRDKNEKSKFFPRIRIA